MDTSVLMVHRNYSKILRSVHFYDNILDKSLVFQILINTLLTKINKILAKKLNVKDTLHIKKQ